MYDTGRHPNDLKLLCVDSSISLVVDGNSLVGAGY